MKGPRCRSLDRADTGDKFLLLALSGMADLAGDGRFRVKSRLAIIRFATGWFWRILLI
jgi:hypothetical protein